MRIKHLLLILSTAFLFLSCTKNNDNTPVHTQAEKDILQIIKGEFVGTLYSPALNLTETEEITFRPYASPKTIKFIGDSRETIIDGAAIIATYFNNHLLEVTENYCYSVNTEMGSQPLVLFYVHSGNEDLTITTEYKRIINPLSNTSFKMRDYGATESEDKTFTKR